MTLLKSSPCDCPRKTPSVRRRSVLKGTETKEEIEAVCWLARQKCWVELGSPYLEGQTQESTVDLESHGTEQGAFAMLPVRNRCSSWNRLSVIGDSLPRCGVDLIEMYTVYLTWSLNRAGTSSPATNLPCFLHRGTEGNHYQVILCESRLFPMTRLCLWRGKASTAVVTGFLGHLDTWSGVIIL